MTGSTQDTLTEDQISKATAMFSQGIKPSEVAKQIGISTYRAKNLLKRKEVAEAIDRMRLTDTIPAKLNAALDLLLASNTMLSNMESRLCGVEEQLRIIKIANRRLKIENKHLRETRRDDRKALREAKAALWRARGY